MNIDFEDLFASIGIAVFMLALIGSVVGGVIAALLPVFGL